jgi:hypothetical protein
MEWSHNSLNYFKIYNINKQGSQVLNPKLLIIKIMSKNKLLLLMEEQLKSLPSFY